MNERTVGHVVSHETITICSETRKGWLWVQKVERLWTSLSSAGLIPLQFQLALIVIHQYFKMVQINLFLLYAVATIAPSLAHPFARFVPTLPLSHL